MIFDFIEKMMTSLIETDATIGKYKRKLNVVGIIICLIPNLVVLGIIFTLLTTMAITISVLIAFTFLISLLFGMKAPKEPERIQHDCGSHNYDNDTEDEEEDESELELEGTVECPPVKEGTINVMLNKVETKPGSYTSDH